MVKVDIAHDSLGIHVGECLQIISGGLLVATPHCVRGVYIDNINCGRANFPVFVDVDIN